MAYESQALPNKILVQCFCELLKKIEDERVSLAESHLLGGSAQSGFHWEDRLPRNLARDFTY